MKRGNEKHDGSVNDSLPDSLGGFSQLDGDKEGADSRAKRRRADDEIASHHHSVIDPPVAFDGDRKEPSPHNLQPGGLSQMLQTVQDPSQLRNDTSVWQSLLLQNPHTHIASGTRLGQGLQGNLALPGGGVARYPTVQGPSAYPSFGVDPRLGFQQQWLAGNFPATANVTAIVNNQYPDFTDAARSAAVETAGVPGPRIGAVASSAVASIAAAEQISSLDQASAALPNTKSDLTGRMPTLLYIPSCDDEALSEYQCLVRKQIELFEASREDSESNAQGRNRPIVLGQVGIRCAHCSFLPPKHRARGATYYPAKLHGLYQAAQNMASGHLCEHCQHVPDVTRRDLLKLRERKSSAGGGKKYWADGTKALGVVESEGCLRFKRG